MEHRRSWYGWLTLLLLGGCGIFSKGPCEAFTLMLCDECEVDREMQDTVCACVGNKEVYNSNRYFASEDDAEQWCYRTRQQVNNRYVDEEQQTECAQELGFFEEFGDDACAYYGFESRPNDETGAGSSDWDGFGWDGDADTDADSDADSDADVQISISWPSDELLVVSLEGLSAGVFGVAETGSDNGWYGEDCVTGSYCKSVIGGDNPFPSVHPDVGGEGVDGVMQNTTLFHGGLHSRLTYAVWDAVTDECVHCSGDDCGYYVDDGC